MEEDEANEVGAATRERREVTEDRTAPGESGGRTAVVNNVRTVGETGRTTERRAARLVKRRSIERVKLGRAGEGAS